MGKSVRRREIVTREMQCEMERDFDGEKSGRIGVRRGEIAMRENGS